MHAKLFSRRAFRRGPQRPRALVGMIIEDMVRTTVRNYEPRVGDIGVEVDASEDTNTVRVKVLFDIIGLEAPVQSFDFILEPTR